MTDDARLTLEAEAEIARVIDDGENPVPTARIVLLSGDAARVLRWWKDTTITLLAEVRALRAEGEQERVRLAGCGVAALGYARDENDCASGDYGWSPAFDDVKRLYERRVNAEAERDALAVQLAETDEQLTQESHARASAEADRVAMRALIARWQQERDETREQLAEAQAELDDWRCGAHADATGHLHRCAKVNGTWRCHAGCAVAERDALLRVARAADEMRLEEDVIYGWDDLVSALAALPLEVRARPPEAP